MDTERTISPPIWHHDLTQDKEFWEWYTTGKLTDEAAATLRNSGASSRDSIIDTLYVWWKMGGKELTSEQVRVVLSVWLNT